jgi:hypothetical protein
MKIFLRCFKAFIEQVKETYAYSYFGSLLDGKKCGMYNSCLEKGKVQMKVSAKIKVKVLNK